MIYACDRCRYLFSEELSIDRCPDCGKENIRPATPEEVREFEERKKTDLWNNDV